MTPEGKVKEKVKALLKAAGVWYCMPLGQMYGKSGVPDFVCCYRGQFLAIETKSAVGKLTARQELERTRIEQAGGRYLVIRPDNVSELEAVLSCNGTDE